MTRPCCSGGYSCISATCASGTSAAPNRPCTMRKATISPRSVANPQATDPTREADDTDGQHAPQAEARTEPACQRRGDRTDDDVRGDDPGDLVLRRLQAALHVRQRDVYDRRIDRVQQRAQHRRQRQHQAAVGLRTECHGARPLASLARVSAAIRTSDRSACAGRCRSTRWRWRRCAAAGRPPWLRC